MSRTGSNYSNRDLHSLIPGGAHTYSRGQDQFPRNAPKLLVKGKQIEVWANDGRKFLDMTMGLRSVSIGHAENSQRRFINKHISTGVNLSLPTPLEFELAERIIELIPSAEMVKFGKNGSDVTSASVRLARAYTGRDVVLRCKDNPFFSVNDWFIGDTPMNAGIPESVRNLTDNFNYGDIGSIEKKIQEHNRNIAAIILEPAGASQLSVPFLQALRQICDREGIILIFDEIISGFRYALGGVQEIAKVSPDLSTFGKAVANGYPLSILAGRKEVMEIGGIKHTRDRVFLMSSTFGPERSGLAAAIWTINQMQKNNGIENNWVMAERMKLHFNEYSASLGLQDRICMEGDAINPLLKLVDENGIPSPKLRATFLYETVEDGLLMNYIALSTRHREKFWRVYREKVEASLNRVRKRLDDGKLEPVGIEPVFRGKN